MKMFDIRRYEMLTRVNAFGVAHPGAFPPTGVGGKLFADLDTLVGTLDRHAVEETGSKSAAREGVKAKDGAAEQLRGQLATLIRTAKVVTASTPGLTGKFRLPRSHSDQRLVSAARSIVQDATPFADAMTAHNLPSTHLADVTAGIDALEASINAHAKAREARAAAGAGIRQQLRAGFAIVEQLDAVVPNQLGADEAALAEWKSARRVLLFNVPFRKQSTATAPAPAPTPVPKPA